MKRRPRIYYNAEQRSLMWDFYQRGESLHTIGRLFDRQRGSIAGIIGRAGGIRPADRTQADITLSIEEREEISRAIVADKSIRAIARELERSPSTISREISRNGGRKKFRVTRADTQAWERANDQKPVSYY